MTPPAPAPATQALTTSARANPLAQVKDGLDRMSTQIRAVLPSHISVDRFNRVVMTAVNLNPDLVSADRRSLFNACTKAATDGLVPDGREGALVIFKDKSGKKLVQWMPMVSGLLKLIRQSGEIDSVGARIVYQREIDEQSPARPERKRFEFIIENGAESLYHDPILWGERGNKVLVYAYARYKDSGYVEYAVLHRQDVEKRRAASKSTSSNSPWVTWETEMWLKTAIRYIAKRLPISSDILQKIDADNDPTEFDKMRHAAIEQLGGSQDIPEEDVVERAATGFANASDKDELDDFAAVIADELAALEIKPEEKAVIDKQIKTAYDTRVAELAHVGG